MPDGTARRDVDPCPLCGASEAVPVREVAYDQIWSWLEEVWGASVSDAVRAANTPVPVTALVACARCGLEYFHPLQPGDSRFYAEVMGTVPYEGSRWEFAVVAGRLGADDRVVDFGAGDGAFLRHVHDRVARAAGVDHNPEAALKAATAGLEVSAGGFPEFAEAHEGRFDVACGFQVIEHVPVVDELLDPMLTCLARPGRLFLSLPNRDRYPTMPADPLDHPPHHLSRWSPAQLHELASRRGLDLVSVEFEEPDFSGATLATRDHWARRLSTRSARPGAVAEWAAKVATKLTLSESKYRRLAEDGAFTRRGVFGHTMLAEFRVA